MKIAIFGASGTIGQRITSEALRRGHTVTAITRKSSHLALQGKEGVTVVQGDIYDAASVVANVAGHQAVISAIGPSGIEEANIVVTAAHSLLQGLEQAGVRRLLVVGGAGSLEVAPGVQLMDSPQFPAPWKPIAQAAADALKVYQNEGSKEIEWTYFSPAALIEPGERTGKFRIGGDQLLSDEQGNSRITAEDFAIAILDEAEAGKNLRRRITVAY